MQQGSIFSNLVQLVLMIGAIWLFSKFACSKEETTTTSTDIPAYDFSVHKTDRIFISKLICRVECTTEVDYTVCLSMVQHVVNTKLDSLHSALQKQVTDKEITPREAGMITNDYIKNLLKH